MERTRTDVEVLTTAGAVRGRERGGLLSWRGIPYAAAPVGPRRWRAPAPAEPWSGVRDATTFGPVPPQERTGEFLGAGKDTPMDEDCLTLNVVAPSAPSEQPRPVMVWFYGGAFVVGAASASTYRGYGLVRTGDVVYVSVNYRLGALGYLDFSAFGSEERPIESNLGLRDQLAALRWVRDNIAAFGGDPDDVTIFGESAGAISVTTLMTVPSARGLFHRAIAESSAPGVAYSRERAGAWGGRFVEELAHVMGRSGDPVGLLDTASTDQLLHAARRFRHVADETPGVLMTAPVVDGDLLPEAPLDAFAAGRSHPVPLIIGTNDTEGRLFELPGLRMDLMVTDERADAVFAATQPELRDQVLAAYRGTPHRRDLGGDYLFWYPSVQVMEAHSAAGNAVYAYRYDLAPRLMHLLGLRATHGAELYAVFGLGGSRFSRVMTALGGRRALSVISRSVRRDWTTFARTGAPASHWPRYTVEDRLTRIIDAHDRIESDPRRGRRLAWAGYRGYR
ncbi:carboxylesterase/lipase family protein [Actinomycetospora termitidis]|uniref:Carboxylic ester hydrolase n=1 Tax=Actinomycetospora termitidis TaxID=3053470 RepID=A0ABT7M2T9_9PSEU|nr:carboxylesterase/lipase family protein [Actinomycetospora sp. Odt1-22]MDL5154983.1 carboxylesterase/lipase family protein [Actinomycetospora sp. Odt1-22]